jgi:putative methionine-R-sulfoxide reductase with GAF domain
MYDPTVVDTFIATHRELAPSMGAEEQSPLRVIGVAPRLREAAVSRFEEIAGSSEEVVTLFELAREMRADGHPTELCDGIFVHVRRLVPFSSSVFFLYEEASDELVAAYVSGESAPLVLGTRISLGQRVSGWVAAHRQSIRNADPVLDLGTAVRMMPMRPKSSLSVAVVADKNLVGVITLYSTQVAAFTEEHERVLQAISGQIAQALSEAFARLGRAQQPEASNRLSGAIKSGSRLVSPTALVFVKLDDARTGSVTESPNTPARRAIREKMVLYLRRGDQILELPDGFAVVLPGTSPAEAERIGIQLRQSTDSELTPLITTTAVVAPEDGASVADLIEVARQRTFQSRRSDSVH